MGMLANLKIIPKYLVASFVVDKKIFVYAIYLPVHMLVQKHALGRMRDAVGGCGACWQGVVGRSGSRQQANMLPIN